MLWTLKSPYKYPQIWKPLKYTPSNKTYIACIATVKRILPYSILYTFLFLSKINSKVGKVLVNICIEK